MSIHADEVPVTEETVRTLLREHLPSCSSAEVRAVGAGTDNTMFRVGDDLVARFPRTPGNVGALTKEITWLPRLAEHLPVEIPRVELAVEAGEIHPLPWAVYRWIDGTPADVEDPTDPAEHGRELARFVRALRSIDLMGASRETEGLGWYRGGTLDLLAEDLDDALPQLRELAGDRLDHDRIAALWHEALALPAPSGSQGWLHGDLKPSNLLLRDGRLGAVIDFGGLCVGFGDCEHQITWEMPAATRNAYYDELGADEETRVRARGWALGIAVNGAAYYWHTFPAMVEGSLVKLDAILADS